MNAPDNRDDDTLLQQTVIRTPAGAAPVEKPAGAMTSVFDMAASAPATVEKSRASHQHKRQALLTALEQGEASSGPLSRLVGFSQSTVSTILIELLAEGLVESNGKLANALRYRLKSKSAAGGFKAWLDKKGVASAEGRARSSKKEAPMPAAEPTVVTGHKATHSRHAAVRAEPSPAPTWSCALVSSGHLVIQANGQEVALDARQARGVTEWLARVDSALVAALGA